MSTATDDYLKTIYALMQSHKRAGTRDISQRLGVSQASVTGMLKRLAATDPPLVDYRKHAGVTLTEQGERRALQVLRHHRLLETFLHRMLGYGWDEVHEEACQLEHVISDRFEERIARLLGNPRSDPHGEPIPDRKLRMPRSASHCLADLPTGASTVIRRVSDADPELLRYLASRAIVPGRQVRVIDRSPFDHNISLRVIGKAGTVVLGPEITRHIFVDQAG